MKIRDLLKTDGVYTMTIKLVCEGDVIEHKGQAVVLNGIGYPFGKHTTITARTVQRVPSCFPFSTEYELDVEVLEYTRTPLPTE
jgi:hypothetical protein